MGYETLLAMAAALAIAVAIPGPGVIAIVSRAVGTGFCDAAAMAAGLVLGDLFFFTAALTGWSAIASLFGNVFLVIRILSVVALTIMGLQMILSSFKPQQAVPPNMGGRRHRAFLAGFVLTLGNPKVILFYLAFLPTFLDLSQIDVWDAMDLVAVIVTVVSTVMLGYAALAARAARCLTHPAFARWMKRSAGTVLIGTGCTIALKQ